MVTIQQALQQFRKENSLALDGGINDSYFELKFKLFTLKLPNFDFRKKVIDIHDIQHIVYDQDTSWKGESFIAGWEIGSKIWKHFPIGFISLWAMGFSMLNYPKQVLLGYKAGIQCKGIIDLDIPRNELLKLSSQEIQQLITLNKSAKFNWVSFSFWVISSLINFLFPLIILLVIWLLL